MDFVFVNQFLFVKVFVITMDWPSRLNYRVLEELLGSQCHLSGSWTKMDERR